jgi:hypothetical protein
MGDRTTTWDKSHSDELRQTRHYPRQRNAGQATHRENIKLQAIEGPTRALSQRVLGPIMCSRYGWRSLVNWLPFINPCAHRRNPLQLQHVHYSLVCVRIVQNRWLPLRRFHDGHILIIPEKPMPARGRTPEILTKKLYILPLRDDSPSRAQTG